MKEAVQKKLETLTTQPGVYLFKDATGKVIYVGKAKNLRNRVRSYFQDARNLDPKTLTMRQRIADLEVIIVDNEVEALILEANLIKKYKPRYNVFLRDDKSYPYIRITNEPFPRVLVTRKIVRDGSRYLGPYTDVKHLRRIMKTIRKIFPIRSCKYRLDAEVIARKKVKLCLDYHIHQCQGPCQGLVSEKEYGQMIRQVEQFLKGKTRDLLKELEERMRHEAEVQNFENAARLRDQIQMIRNYYFNAQKVSLPDFEDRDVVAVAHQEDDACAVVFKIRDGKVVGRQHFYLQGVEGKTRADILEQFLQQYYLEADTIPGQILLPETPGDSEAVLRSFLERQAHRKVELVVPRIGEKKKLMNLCQKNAEYLLGELTLQKMKHREKVATAVSELQRMLNLPRLPMRIEAFDISNFQGKDAVASLVCFMNGKPRKSEYRHFRIRSKDTPDDFAMMREVVFRRYHRLLEEKKPLPDLILVDGGKGQLSSAREVLVKLGLADQPIIGLAKRLEEVFLPEVSQPQNIPKRSAALRLLQHVRDESHRFAIEYHRKLRRKRTLKSPLEEIPGIGPRRRDQLLRAFGSLKKIRQASVPDLMEKGKLPRNVAERVAEALGSREDKTGIEEGEV